MLAYREMNFRKIFEALVNFFEKRDLDFAIIGAFALKTYGYQRATTDLDFIVRRKDQETITRFMESLGFETVYRSKGFSNHVHPISSMGRIDFIYVAKPTGDEIFANTKKLEVLKGRELPVVSPEHIVALKVFAIKNDPRRTLKELADIKALLETTGIKKEMIKKYFEKWNLLEKYYELDRENDDTRS